MQPLTHVISLEAILAWGYLKDALTLSFLTSWVDEIPAFFWDCDSFELNIIQINS